MRDFITALMGGKHCGWCTYKPDTFFEKKWGGYQGDPATKTLPARIYWKWVDLQYHLRIWMLGQEWHFRVHERVRGKATWR